MKFFSVKINTQKLANSGGGLETWFGKVVWNAPILPSIASSAATLPYYHHPN